VLPYIPNKASRRWLLKMHGTISHPDEIVLSKRDYMRYHDRYLWVAIGCWLFIAIYLFYLFIYF
jgi:hypothetical protein